MKKLLTLLGILCFSLSLSAQEESDFYSINSIQDIRITFATTQWQSTLDSLFQNYGDEGRLVGDVAINGQIFKKAGVRYKGYSSWNEGEIKNPLNIDLDYTLPNQNYKGHAKIKLSNVINDPSFVRETLAYEIARKYMPASRANFAAVYINDAYIGLYTNVEAVDKKFVKEHFGFSSSSFFKGEPDTLKYPFGQNANLAYTHGDDSTGYYPYYKMESDHGWTDLFNFIKELDEHPDSIDKVLNTDRALWMHAFNYSLLNLDSYIGYSQNYYLYKDQNGRFNPLIWDLNMSFGSFRESDGSYGFLGLSIPKIKVLDPLEHLHFSISPRPLMTSLFKNDTLGRMYLAHLRTIMKENFINGSYYERAKEMQSLIAADVLADSNKFYTYQDFIKNADSTVGGTGNMILYPGIKDLMAARMSYLSTYPGFSGEPTIEAITNEPEIPAVGNPFWIRCKATSASRVFLYYRNNHTDVFSRAVMMDDGTSHDGEAHDGIYGAKVQSAGELIQYYLYAENDIAGEFSPERAQFEFYSIQPDILPGTLVINELMTAGTDINSGENPLQNDWVELLNEGNETVYLKGFSLVLEPAGQQLMFPDTLIEPGSLYLGWADASGTGFSLPSGNSRILLYNSNGKLIDSLGYSWLNSGKSIGRYPNGYGSFVYMNLSPGKMNSVGISPLSGIKVFPNPARDRVTLEFSSSSPVSLEVFNSTGECLVHKEYYPDPSYISSIEIPLDVSRFPAGLYMVRIDGDEGTRTQKFMVY